MSGLKTIIISVGIVIFLLPANPAAQQKNAKFGPVVTAYLTGLGEELRELDYQIRRNEISRADYLRTKQRLSVLRRLVERVAAGNSSGNMEDVVPEVQILAKDELKSLGPASELDPDHLTAGAGFDNQWRFFGVEPAGKTKRTQFFICERLRRNEASSQGEAVSERKRNKQTDLLAVETIIVDERPPQAASPQPQSGLGYGTGQPT